MATNIETRVKITIETSAPFSITLEPRKDNTALFYITHSGNGPLDADWIPTLIKELQEAEKYAEMLDDSNTPTFDSVHVSKRKGK